MVGTDSPGEADHVVGAEQHPISSTAIVRLASTSERDIRTKAAMEGNDSTEWRPSDMLRALAQRIDRGELVADRAIVVLLDIKEDTIVQCAAGTSNIFEHYGILALALQQ